ncbi:hypothetical protein DVH05_000815 [Phytophthora capsici]|nr:hypothetical protein DVH05_000815 [Phytophthora capsici]
MRLTSIAFVAAASIFVCFQEASAVSDSKGPESRVQTANSDNRFLRIDQDEEERAGPQPSKSLLEKFTSKVTATKLKRSKAVADLTKLDDVVYLKATPGYNVPLFQRIEKMGFNPDGMLLKMRERGKIDQTLLKHYTNYWKGKYPTWTSNPSV